MRSAVAVSAVWTRRSGPLVIAILALGLVVALAPLQLAVLIVGGGALFLLTLVRVEWGLAALALSVPLAPLLEIPLGGVRVGATDAIALLVFAGWLARRLAAPWESWRLPPLVLPLLTLLVALSVASLPAQSMEFSLRELVRWMELAAIFVVAASVLDGKRRSWALLGIFAAAGLEAAFGYYQFLTQAGPPSFAFGPFARAFGTFGQPNPYAGYLLMSLPLAASLALWGLSARNRGYGGFVLFGGLAAALGLAVLMSLSRGAWLGLAVGLLVIVGLFHRRALVILIAGGVALVLLLELGGAGFLPGALRLRLGDIIQYFGIFDVREVVVTPLNWSVVERMAHWQAAWEMFQSSPFLGIGTGNYTVAYLDFRIPPWWDPLGHAHNIYLNILAEAGVVGFGAFLLFWLGALWRVGQRAWAGRYHGRGEWPFTHALTAGALGVLVAVSIHSGFDNLFVQGMNLQIALVLGLALSSGDG